MKRLFMILSATLGPVVLTFGQEDNTKLRLSNLSPKLVGDSIPVIVYNSRKPFADNNKTFSTYPMPNGYRGDNCVPMPNAYSEDNSVSMPNLYQGPIIRYHPADSTQHPLKKYERKKDEEAE